MNKKGAGENIIDGMKQCGLVKATKLLEADINHHFVALPSHAKQSVVTCKQTLLNHVGL